MKVAHALALLTLAAVLAAPAAAAPDSHFDGSVNTVTGDTPVLNAGGAQRSYDLTAESPTRSFDQGQQPPSPGNGGPGGMLGQYKTGLIAGAAGGAIGALLAFGMGFPPVGIAGLALLGAGVGLGLMGKSPMEHLIGAGLGGTGMGLGLALAMGMPFGWPMMALAAVGAATMAGAVYLFGK